MTDADDALKALKALGWHPGCYVGEGIRHMDCAFLFADGTLMAGEHVRIRMIGPNLPVATDAKMEQAMNQKVVTENEYAVAWRLHK